MNDRPLILITGATDGIGHPAALELAQRGADLILTARNENKAERTREAIAAVAPTASIDIYLVDFADLAAVATTGRAIAARHPRIDVLINNAGLHAFQQRVTKDGFAEMIAVNYLAPWLLTDILRDILLASSFSRIVTVGSEASQQSVSRDIISDLFATATFTARGSSKVYGFSKLLDIMFSLELARQLEGTGVAVNCLCPGFNVTGLGRELGFARPLAWLLKKLGGPELCAIADCGHDRSRFDRAHAGGRSQTLTFRTGFMPSDDPRFHPTELLGQRVNVPEEALQRLSCFEGHRRLVGR
nr:SDR family NAD(P)-dependent oxidoreductase [Novosphingobium barchaimii]